jgi:glutathione S-transferase
MLLILGRRDSINVMKVLWACEELDLPFERVDVGGRFAFANRPDYRQLNPNGRVPTVDDDGFVLWESNVIIRYLADRYGGGRLLPAGRARWIGEQWMDWQQTTLLPPMRTVFWQLVRTPPEKQDMAAVRTGHAELVQLWPMLDEHLTRSAFVAGDHFSVADIPLGCMAYRWYAFAGLERPSLPHLEAWWTRLRERVGYRKHLTLPLT